MEESNCSAVQNALSSKWSLMEKRLFKKLMHEPLSMPEKPFVQHLVKTRPFFRLKKPFQNKYKNKYNRSREIFCTIEVQSVYELYCIFYPGFFTFFIDWSTRKFYNYIHDDYIFSSVLLLRNWTPLPKMNSTKTKKNTGIYWKYLKEYFPKGECKI